MLQEAHVAIEQGVRRRQDPYRLHSRPPLHGALHCHVGKAGQAKVAALPEVAAGGGERDSQGDRRSHESWKANSLPDGCVFFFPLCLFLDFFFCQATLCFILSIMETSARILILKLRFLQFIQKWSHFFVVQIPTLMHAHLHKVCGDSVGATGDGFELHSLQVHVFGQTPLQHVSYHTHTTRKDQKTHVEADKHWRRC